MEKPLKGFFVTLEGGEGSGKTTLLHRLKDDLENEGHSVLLTFEPGCSEIGKQIRLWILEESQNHPLEPLAELMLFLADRAQHIHECIRPALEEGKIVLCDRFTDSTVAYQGFARGLDVPRVQEICELVSGYVKPFLTIFLDVEPVVGLERTRQATKSGKMDRIESESVEFHKQIHKGFHWLHEQEPQRIVLVDANKPIEEVHQEAKTLIFDRIKEYV
ncbi:MAG: Thymidylate kinase [Chlamydiae bacterium]|nr:Thymidylate kinase [Chlamydiota bacterium]